MKLKLQRYLFTDDYTMGLLFIDDVYFCDTLEDKYRGQDLKDKKVYGETCIPYGVYDVKITWSPRHKKKMPQIMDVPYFDGIRFDVANSAKEILGCVAIGIKSENGKVLQSRKTYNAFIKRLETANHIKIDIC